MKIVITLIAVVLGVALWLGAAFGKDNGGGTGGNCGYCNMQTCTRGNVDSTCVGGFDGKFSWCQSSSGCAGHRL